MLLKVQSSADFIVIYFRREWNHWICGASQQLLGVCGPWVVDYAREERESARSLLGVCKPQSDADFREPREFAGGTNRPAELFHLMDQFRFISPQPRPGWEKTVRWDLRPHHKALLEL